jgi:organic radical activating enzyme
MIRDETQISNGHSPRCRNGGTNVSIGQTMTRSKRDNENYQQYTDRVLNSKSASFCGAKWYNATIWLGSGQTTSCHHPLPHAIDLEEIKTNPSAIHNTKEKKQQRAEMQQGIRPKGCEYCWRLEDAGTTSDRPHKSAIFSEEELNTAYETPSTQDVNLRTLEIAFDRTCQFACSYCNPAFSSTWAKDIKIAGPYTELVTDGRGHYSHAHDGSQRYGFAEVNPYAEAFFAWWEQGLHKDLRELRLTGGEPLMSGYTWKLLDWFNENTPDCALAINTNLGIDEKKLDEFLEKTADVPHLEIYTSNEAVLAKAEYIRDGLDAV